MTMHICVQWKPIIIMVTNGQKKKIGCIKRVAVLQLGRVKFHYLRVIMTNTPYNGLVILEQLFSL